MKEFDLRGNIINDESAAFLSACLYNVKELNVSECQLTARGVENLAEGIKSLLFHQVNFCAYQ